MISEKLMSILACPVTHKPLVMASTELLDKINSTISNQECYTIEKKKIASLIESALYEPDSGFVYRIEHNIPVLLKEEAISSKNL